MRAHGLALSVWFGWFAAWNAMAAQTYSDVQDLIHDLALAHPATTRVFNLGLSDSEEMIQGVIIGSGPLTSLVVAAHHGNEYGSVEVALGLARSLAEDPIEGYRVIIVPVLNTSGYDQRQREEWAEGNLHDPNRDYPGPCGTAGPYNLRSTHLLAELIERMDVVSLATLHTYWPAVVYPWGITTEQTSTEYDLTFHNLATVAATWSQYKVGNSTQVIYPANGTLEDYAFWKHGIWSLLFEVGHSHSPDGDDIDEMIRVNVPGIRAMIQEAPTERATNHEFLGTCSNELEALDLHIE